MGLRTGASVAVLAVLAATSAAASTTKCARPDELTAVQVAAVQQELMVAALTCNEIEHFNAFQTGFGPELRVWDGRLQRMFLRLFGHRQGQGEYHAYKTRLANNSSIRSIRNNSDFCHEAGQFFAAALVAERPKLAAFVAGLPVIDQGPVASCEVHTANGGKAGPDVVPRPNPDRVANLGAPSSIRGGAQPGGASPATTATAGN
jgi:hypothetical protein